jgi:hypothetical protein
VAGGEPALAELLGAAGNRSGTGTSTGTTTFVAGNTLEVHLPATADNVVATFGVGYGPTP